MDVKVNESLLVAEIDGVEVVLIILEIRAVEVCRREGMPMFVAPISMFTYHNISYFTTLPFVFLNWNRKGKWTVR